MYKTILKHLHKSESQLKLGTKIESEHKEAIQQIISDVKAGKVKPLKEYFKEIASAHLEEIKDYYDRLIEMEKEAKKEELDKSEEVSLAKAQPAIKVPNQKDISSRPDQEVYSLPAGPSKTGYAEKKVANLYGSKEVGQKRYSDLQEGGSSRGAFFGQKKEKGPVSAIQKPGSDPDIAIHEGHHLLAHQLKDKFGVEQTNQFYDKLLTHLEPHVHEYLDNHLKQYPQYKKIAESKDPYDQMQYKVEKINMVRDSIGSTAKRQHMREHFGVNDKGESLSGHEIHGKIFKRFDKGLKNSWKNMVQDAKGHKFGQAQDGQKLAASEDIGIDLEKGWGNAIRAGGLALVLARGAMEIGSNPESVRSPASVKESQPTEHVKTQEKVDPNLKFHTMNAIGTIEGPKQDPIKGDPKGHNPYNMSALAIKETIKGNPDLNVKYGHVVSQPNNTLYNYIEENHPSLHREVANAYYDKLQSHFGNDPAKISHAWHYGVNTTKKEFGQTPNMSGHWYVSKVMNKIKGFDESK